MDPEVGYSQGYNYIIALLLRFIPDEESCFWCFIKIMTEMNWRRFFIVSDPTMATLQADMPEFLQLSCPRLYSKMKEDCEIELMSLTFTLPQRYLMSIFTCEQPIEISKSILDLFIFESSGERCLLRILSKMLSHIEERCLSMGEKQVFQYINKGEFVQDCFREISLENLFRDDNTF